MLELMYYPLGHTASHVFVMELYVKGGLHERHEFEADPKQVAQEELQLKQIGEGVVDLY